MIEPSQELLMALLEKLDSAPGKKLGRGKLTLSGNLLKSLNVKGNAAEEALDYLVARQYATRTSAGSGYTFRLTQEGAAYLQNLEPASVATNQELFGYQKAFVLLKFFVTQSRAMTQAQLEQRLQGKPAGDLAFGDMVEGEGGEPKLVVNSRLVGMILRGFVQQRALERKGARYELTEQGEELLGASEQYPTFEFAFKITGREFNRLREAIRRGLTLDGTEAAPHEAGQRTISEPPQPLLPSTKLDEEAPKGVARSLSASAVLELVEELRNEKYLRTGAVPIWELRRLVASRLGAEAASHRVFDTLLKQLRRQDRIRLVAIGDPSQATREELDDSIPGEGETFIYLEVAHEHAAFA